MSQKGQSRKQSPNRFLGLIGLSVVMMLTACEVFDFFPDKSSSSNHGPSHKDEAALAPKSGVAGASDTRTPMTTISRESTEFHEPLCLRLTSDEAGARIYLSLDRSTPVANETFAYHPEVTTTCGDNSSCPLCLKDKSMAVMFFSVDEAGNTEAVQAKEYSYTAIPAAARVGSAVDLSVPVVSVLVGGHDLVDTEKLSTTHVDASFAVSKDADIFYTLDGSAPNLNSLKQPMISQSSMPISSTTTIRYFARDQAGNISAPGLKTIRIETAH